MKTLYIDCGMGAAGDMLTAALLELVPDKKEILDKLNSLGIPGVRIEAVPSEKCGIYGTHINVTINGEEEGEHSHEHEHSHHHSSMHDIEHIIDSLGVNDKVKNDVISIYKLIAEAESKAHNKPVSEIHFHEVGAMDAVADIVSVAFLMDKLQIDKVVAAPVNVGGGTVVCAHGVLPVPAPATAYILRNVPTYSGEIKSELCTPTGAAILKYYVSEFGNMPVMTCEAVGYGMGKKDFRIANCVRVFLGETKTQDEDTIVELSCNLDDMTPEEIGYAMETLFAAGALDVYTVSIGMKKNRPGVMLNVLCKPDNKEHIIMEMFRNTSTIGIRENISKRYTLNRKVETTDTPYGIVRKKVSEGYGVVREKYEYEDIASIARRENLSIEDVRQRVQYIEKG